MTKSERAVLECGYLADDALKAYIAIHNRIFVEQATFISCLKNIAGIGMPFEDLLAEAKTAFHMWNDFSNSAVRTRSTHRAAVTEEEALFLDSMVAYAAAVRATTEILVERQELLLRRKFNPKDVSWSAYKDVEHRYEAAVEGYRSLGRDLNTRIHRIFDLAEERSKKPSPE